HLKMADEYIKDIKTRNILLFCKIPLALAKQTLDTMKKGIEKMTRQEVQATVDKIVNDRHVVTTIGKWRNTVVTIVLLYLRNVDFYTALKHGFAFHNRWLKITNISRLRDFLRVFDSYKRLVNVYVFFIQLTNAEAPLIIDNCFNNTEQADGFVKKHIPSNGL